MARAMESTPLRMLQIVLHAILGEFSFDAVARAAHSGTFRIAALDHEASDHSVEDQTVIEMAADQAEKIVDGNGSDIGIKLRPDHVSVFHGDGNNGILCHK